VAPAPAAPAPGPGWRRALKLALVCILPLAVTSFVFCALTWGLYSEGGATRDWIYARSVVARTMLNKVPEVERGLLWRLDSLRVKLAHEIPAFLIGFQGDRAWMYSKLEEQGVGEATGFRNSFALFNFSAVSGVLTSKEQPRGPFLGGSESPERCMGHDTLIFLGTGETHTQVRRFLIDNIPAWTASDFGKNAALLDLDYGDDAVCAAGGGDGVPTEDFDAIVKRALVRTLFKTMFEGPIDATTLQAFTDYATWGGTCVLGTDFHTLTAGVALRKVASLRKTLAAGVLASPRGGKIKAAAALAAAEGRLPNATADDRSGHAIIRQLADGAAFAGMLGTSHLATHALRRMRSHPRRYVPLYDADPTAFLHEEARVDPPVTSVTGVLGATTNLTLAEVKEKVAFPKGTPYQLVISTANTDPNVFGGDFHSNHIANTFDVTRNHSAVLSWNGRLDEVAAFKAPRGCPGYRLSMLLAQSVVSAFKPAKDALPAATMGHTGRMAKPVVPGGGHGEDEIIGGGEAAVSGGTTGHSLLDITGYLLWTGCALGGVGWLCHATDGSFGPVTMAYIGYLLAQASIGISFVLDNHAGKLIFLLCELFAATMYMLLFITCTCQANEMRGMVASAVVWLCWFITSSFISITFLVFGPIGSLQLVASLYYSVGCGMGVGSIYLFKKAVLERALSGEQGSVQQAPAMLKAANSGAIGAFFGIVDLAFIPIPVVGTFVSRLMDSLFYVPNMLHAIVFMDTFYLKVVTIPTRRCMLVGGKAVVVGLLLLFVGIAAVEPQTRDMCGFAATRPASGNLCTSTELSNVDLYGRLMYKAVVVTVSATPARIASVEDPRAIMLPKYEKKLDSMEAIPGTNWKIPTEDEDCPWKDEWYVALAKKFFVQDVFGHPGLFPVADSPAKWSNLSLATEVLQAAGGNLLPKPVGNWDGKDVTSDETIAQMCFAGLAGVRLRPSAETDALGSRFVADFLELAQLPVRPGFERYGAAAYFNVKQEVTKIRWRKIDVVPGHPMWAHAKWVFRCSALLGITANEHLLQSHLIIANVVDTAARETLPSHHPLRRLIKPFTHRTPTVNLGAQQMLTREFSLLHRATSLTYDGLQAAFKLSLVNVDLAPDPMSEAVDLLQRGSAENAAFDFPFAEDGKALLEVINKFVSNYFDLYYPDAASLQADENLKQFWASRKTARHNRGVHLPPWNAESAKHVKALAASTIFHVTGIHHVVGNVAEYLVKPEFTSTRIRPDAEVSDVESSHYGLLVAILTGMKAPKLINDFSHLVLDDTNRQQAVAILNTFQADLKTLAHDIDARNEKRKWKFDGFNPNFLLSSISI
jgi:hypothetical protein